MTNEDILRLALEKTSTIAEAKEAAEWMKRFLVEAAPPEFTEKAKDILAKPNNAPAVLVAHDRRPSNWDIEWVVAPPMPKPKRKKRTKSAAKNANRPVTQKELDYVKERLPFIKTKQDFQTLANELGRPKKGIYEWVLRKINIDPLLLPPTVFPTLHKKAVEEATAKAKANG